MIVVNRLYININILNLRTDYGVSGSYQMLYIVRSILDLI